MTQIIVDHLLRGRLRDLSERLEFVDEFGALLGYFTPSQVRTDQGGDTGLTDAAVADVQLSHAELLKLAIANPPASEWFEGDEECPFR